MTVTRWGNESLMQPSDDGNWVAWEDYDALRMEVDRLTRENACLREVIESRDRALGFVPLPHPDWRSGKVQDEPRAEFDSSLIPDCPQCRAQHWPDCDMLGGAEKTTAES